MPKFQEEIQLLTKPDLWALKLGLKVDGRPFSLEGAEYTVPVLRDTSRKMVVKKGAQTRFTILFLVRTFHWITERGWQHMYLLPAKTGAIPFVQKRVDPIIASSQRLSQKFKAVDNRTHKQTTDDIALLIRGANVESELQETNVDVVIFDEYDRMATDFLSDARHRTDGSLIKRLTYLSTPSEPGHGLDGDDMWWASDMMKWFVQCPGCSRFQTLTMDTHLRIGDTQYDCRLECEFCSRTFKDHERAAANATGYWEPTNLEDGKFRGYHINQFNSPTMMLSDIMEDFFEGQRDAKRLKAFYNQSLGEPYAGEGAQITPEILDKCILKGYQMGGIPNGPVFIGVDVGHDEIYIKCDHILRNGQRAVWAMHHIKDRPGLDAWDWLDENLLSKLTNWIAVCDAHPDKRGANKLAAKYRGQFWMGFEKDRPDQEEVAKYDKPARGEAGKVIIDRTLAFDTVIFEMLHGMYALPGHARMLGEEMPRRDYNGFYHHMIQQVRVQEEDAKGIVTSRWKKNKNADHWHHADMFAKVATLGKPKMRIPTNMSTALRRAGTPAAA